MRLDEFVEGLKSRLVGYQEVPATVDAETLCRLILRDAELIRLEADEEWISISEAAKICNYSPQQLRRLINAGQLAARRDGRTRVVCRKDLPRKPAKVAKEDDNLHLFASSAEQAVRESVGAS